MNIFSTHSSTSDRRVDPHSNAASYGPTSCFFADSGWCQRRTLEHIFMLYPSNNNWFRYSYHLSSSSYIFIKPSSKITWQKLLLPMRVDGISTLKSFMLKRNGQKQSWSHLWLTIVRTVVFFFFFGVSLRCVSPFSSFADPIFLILYRELYYRHVYSRLQPNIDDRFHSYENSCELFNYLLSAFHHNQQVNKCNKNMTYNVLQILKDLYSLNCRNNGSGISSTNSSINIRFSVLGDQKLLRKHRMNLQCWLRVALWGPFIMSVCKFQSADLFFHRFGVHIVFWTFSIPSCKNLKSMNTSLLNEKENHQRKLRTFADFGISYLQDSYNLDVSVTSWVNMDSVLSTGCLATSASSGFFESMSTLGISHSLSRSWTTLSSTKRLGNELLIFIQILIINITSLPLHV